MSHPEHPQTPVSPEVPPATEAATEPAAEEAVAADMERAAPEATGKDAIAAFAAQTPVGAGGKKSRAARSPKKHRRLAVLLISLAAVLLLGGAVAVLTHVITPTEEEPEPELPDTSVVLVDKALGEDGKELETPIKSIHIASRLDDYTLALNDDGVMMLADGEGLPVNSTNVDALVDALTYVVAEDTVLTNAESVTDYGLDSPTVTVEVTYADDVTVKLEMAALAVGSHYYLRLDGGDTVYLMDSTLPTEVMQTAEAFVGLTMISAPSVGSSDANGSVVLKELSLTGKVRNDQITTIRRKEAEESEEYANSVYLLTEPYFNDTDTVTVNEVSAVTAVTASDVVALHPTEAQLEEYGLKDPYSVAKIVLAVYTYTSDDNGNMATEGYYNETTHLMLLGNKDEDGNYYAMVDAMDVVFLVAADSVPWAEKTYQDLANQYLFLRSLNTLSSIACTLDGRENDFTLEHFPDAEELDDQLRVTLDGTQYPTDQFRELYKVLMTLYRTGPAPAEPEGEPLLTVRITPSDPTFDVKEIAIYDYSGSVYIARTKDGDTYKVTASRVDDAIQQIRNYLNGDKVVNRF